MILETYAVVNNFGIVADGTDLCQSLNGVWFEFSSITLFINGLHGPVRRKRAAWDWKLARCTCLGVYNEELQRKTQFRFCVNIRLSRTRFTLIWLVVSVPVLSEQITLVQPRVSTLGRFLTIALFLAIFWVPRARQAVMTAARPSGIAATASATAILK